MAGLLQDVRYGLRSLRRSPGFTIVVLLSLALGIGGTSAVFGVVYSARFESLPYPDADELVYIAGSTAEACSESCVDGFSGEQFQVWKRATHSLGSLAAHREVSGALRTPSGPMRVSGAAVSGDFFATLRPRVLAGRSLQPSDDAQSSEPVTVLSYSLWKRVYDGNQQVVGDHVRISGHVYTIVGVMAANLDFPRGSQFWVPMAAAFDTTSPTTMQLFGVGRLRRGVPLEVARSELRTIARAEQEAAHASPLRGVAIFSLGALSHRLLDTSFVAIAAAIGFAFLIACTNLEMLFLVRAMGRGKEIVLRASLGASRARLARQLVVESLMIALAGGALGAWLAVVGSGPAAAFVSRELGFPVAVHVNIWFLLFAITVSVVTGALVGLAPMLHVRTMDLRTVLSQSANSASASRGHRQLRGALVAFEVACVLVLVAAGAALAKTVGYLHGVDLGYDLDRILVASIDFQGTRHTDPRQAQALTTQVVEALGQMPAAMGAAAWSTSSPYGLWKESDDRITIEGRAERLPHECSGPDACWQPRFSQDVSSDFFQVMGIRIVRGRSFRMSDRVGSEPVAVVTEKAAAFWWPGEDAIGKRFKWGPQVSDFPWMTIVGIAADVHDPDERGLTTAAAHPGKFYPTIFRPFAQQGLGTLGRVAWAAPLRIAVRAREDIRGLDRLARSEIQQVAPDALVDEVTSLRHLVREYGQYDGFKLNAEIVGAVALLGIFLAVLGLEGVVAETARRRRKEIAIRTALGAQLLDIVRRVVQDGAALAATGSLVGVLVSVTLNSLIARVFLLEGQYNSPFMLHPTVLNGPLLAVTVVLVCLVVILGSVGPAVRIARSDPLPALREE